MMPVLQLRYPKAQRRQAEVKEVDLNQQGGRSDGFDVGDGQAANRFPGRQPAGAGGDAGNQGQEERDDGYQKGVAQSLHEKRHVLPDDSEIKAFEHG